MKWDVRGKSGPRKKRYRYPFSVIMPWYCLSWMVEKGTSPLSFAYLPFSAFVGWGFFFNRSAVYILSRFTCNLTIFCLERFLAKGLQQTKHQGQTKLTITRAHGKTEKNKRYFVTIKRLFFPGPAQMRSSWSGPSVGGLFWVMFSAFFSKAARWFRHARPGQCCPILHKGKNGGNEWGKSKKSAKKIRPTAVFRIKRFF